MDVAIKPIDANQTLALRQAVLWPNHPLHHVKVEGDEDALHLGGLRGEQLIAVASFFPQHRKAQLRKLAVLPDHQKAGLGSKLVVHGAQKLADEDFEELWCDARRDALGFYTRLGFQIDPVVFDKSGVLYQKAFRPLERLAALA